MKKIILIVFCLFLPITANCSDSKEFSVLWSVLASLHLLDWGSSYEIDENDDMIEMMTKLMNQNSRYQDAARTVEDYINDKDKYISAVTKGIRTGALILVDTNNKILMKMKKTSNNEEEGFQDLEYDVAETNAMKKRAWEGILLSAAWTMPIFLEFPKEGEVPTGKIPFKISEKDRKLLINRIDELFSEKLKKYKTFNENTKQGKEANPNDSTYIISGVKRLRDYLAVETYEEAKALEQ